MTPRPAWSRKGVALLYGIITHGAFAVAVALMLFNLHQGMTRTWGRATGVVGVLANALLLLQFPLLHSFLLSRRGRALLARMAPRAVGADLSTTTFAALAAIQLILTFAFWSPSGVVWWRPTGLASSVVTNALYVASWLVLLKALHDSGLPLQMGSLGWTSVLRGRRPVYPSFTTQGLYRLCRQPIYLSFALTLWTGPVWTPDRLVLATCWTAYCLYAPRWKERRFVQRYGDAFRGYQAAVPYMVPRWRRTA